MSVMYWYLAGTLALISLTWQDYTRRMRIDDRRNWVMMGLSISLFSHVSHPWYYMIALIAASIGLNIYFQKFKVMGEGDINTMSWLVLGFGTLGIPSLLLFVAVFIELSILYMILKKLFFPRMTESPFYGVIFLAWVLTLSKAHLLI